MTTVVLGWDGLDYEIVREYGLEDAFGDRVKPIETLTNPELEKPHTWELWPSIITGQRPASHGIHADEYIESNWSNPLLRGAATLSKPIPDAIRWRVGRWIRGNGATMAFETPDYYRDNSIETIFDGRAAFPLAIPNYRSDVDDRYGISHDRGAALAEFMQVETDENGNTRRTPTVTHDTFAGQIGGDCGRKIGLVRHALNADYDLVFAWLAYLDTAGHIAPTTDSPNQWMQDHYQTAANYTTLIRDELADDDTLFCLSDHGLQDGVHTETACIGSTPAESIRGVEGVLDVADAIDRTAESSGSTDATFGTDDAEAKAVRDRLEDLGYVN